MNDNIAQPRLGRETLSGFRLYQFESENDEGDSDLYLGLWAVHGSGDNQVEYPVAVHHEGESMMMSADPRYNSGDQPDLLGDEFYEYLAGSVARIHEEDDGLLALQTMPAFAPEEWEGNEVWAAQKLIAMISEGDESGFVPFEAEYALERGMESVEGTIESDDFDLEGDSE